MSKQRQYDKVGLLGIDVDTISSAEAIEYITSLGANRSSPAAYVVKPYVEFLTAAAKLPGIAELIDDAELVIADGVALQWAAHYLYAGPRTTWRFWKTLFQITLSPKSITWPIPDRAAGINFTWPLLESASQRGLRTYLIGKSSQTEIDAVANVIRGRLPGLTIVGVTSGRDTSSSYGEVSTVWMDNTAALIRESRADLILVGMGFPLQERVAQYFSNNLAHGVSIGEGGTFDYESFGGNRPKAPAFFQKVGLEWFWRLLLEPKRLVRQLAIPHFLYLIWRSRR